MKKIVIGISGMSGVQYAIALLKELKGKVEIHLVMSDWGKKLIEIETDENVEEVLSLADVVYDNKNMAASISSSSFQVDGMIVFASMKTMSQIANASCDTLIARAADIMLRMRKKLVVAFRETPLSVPALENLHRIGLAGGIVLPLSPGFYHKPKSIDDQINFIVGKCLDCLEIENQKFKRWKGKEKEQLNTKTWDNF